MVQPNSKNILIFKKIAIVVVQSESHIMDVIY